MGQPDFEQKKGDYPNEYDYEPPQQMMQTKHIELVLPEPPVSKLNYLNEVLTMVSLLVVIATGIWGYRANKKRAKKLTEPPFKK